MVQLSYICTEFSLNPIEFIKEGLLDLHQLIKTVMLQCRDVTIHRCITIFCTMKHVSYREHTIAIVLLKHSHSLKLELYSVSVLLSWRKK